MKKIIKRLMRTKISIRLLIEDDVRKMRNAYHPMIVLNMVIVNVNLAFCVQVAMENV